MKYIVSVEFWKALARQIAADGEKSWDIVFRQKRRDRVWHLSGFNNTVQSPTREGVRHGRVIVVGDRNEVTDYTPDPSRVPETGYFAILVVAADIKHYSFTHRLWLFENGELTWQSNLPLTAELAGLMDPMELLKSAGKNNLTLMTFRFAPKIDLDQIYKTRCLILGSGTLGCNVARGLLTWGIESITFIDNANVSHSNLLRQSLFEYSDLGRPKAVAAAERVTKIYPPAAPTVEGIEFSIPMPDHPDTAKNIVQDVAWLEKLMCSNDLVFLCTDNRESRWLPTLIAVDHNIPLINLAVGFDSWVVMRHPLAVNPSTPCEATRRWPSPTVLSPFFSDFPDQWNGLVSSEMGCYFCTSVEGVHNSVRGREIDERCTVTRGGTGSIACAVAVELAVALLSHPSGFRATAIADCDQFDNELSLQHPPQQIRGCVGRLASWHGLARRNPQCVACSNRVLDCYRDPLTRNKFLREVCQDSSILKRITHLDQFELAASRDDLLEIND